MANKRRKAREAALQILYMHDLGKPEKLPVAIRRYWENDWVVESDCHLCTEDCRDRGKPKSRFSSPVNRLAEIPFAEQLASGVLEHLKEIDQEIEERSHHWKLSRMSFIDRNILRIALYELIFCDDIPPNVSINEAIEVAKTYGDKNSAAFINGILDQVKK
ncbi:MAG: transcription antitermination factor NusB [Deltaproteobacteria bacterium]|nr:transcription antitermination factor NusB [Deltaproteobacteria bacterium]